jgi:hypothetical protein
VRHNVPPSAETSRFIIWGVRTNSLMAGPYPTDCTAVNRSSYRQFCRNIHPPAQSILMSPAHAAGAIAPGGRALDGRGRPVPNDFQ